MFLKFKALCIKNSKICQNIGLKLLGIYTIIMVIIGSVRFELIYIPKYMESILWVISIIAIIICMIFKGLSEMRFNEHNKFQLCYRLKSKYPKCDIIIKDITNSIKNSCKQNNRMLLDFTHKDIKVGHIDLNEYGEPFVCIDVKRWHTMYPHTNMNIEYVIYPVIYPDHALYLKEFLCSTTNSEADLYELEKTYFNYCS